MKKGDKVFLRGHFHGVNEIYWEDLGNGLSLTLNPNFYSIHVVATEDIEIGKENSYKLEDIKHCMENLVSKQMSVEEFFQEIALKQESIKKMILGTAKYENITDQFFCDIFNTMGILVSSDENIELLRLYSKLSKILKSICYEDVIGVIAVEDLKLKNTMHIIMNKNVKKNIYIDNYDIVKNICVD